MVKNSALVGFVWKSCAFVSPFAEPEFSVLLFVLILVGGLMLILGLVVGWKMKRDKKGGEKLERKSKEQALV